MEEAYSAGASAWADGPTRLYSRLAETLVDFSPVTLHNQSVLDLGAGTGDGSHAAQKAGAVVVALDLSVDMLRIDQAARPPATAGDALALPFDKDCFDVVLAPFSLNHLDDPAPGFCEAIRVGRLLLASTYAADDDHPAKSAVETALEESGWERPAWYSRLKISMAAWGSVADATDLITRCGLEPVRVERREVAFTDLTPTDMVAWRMGLAQCSPFVAALDAEARTHAVARSLELLGPDPIPVVRRLILLAAGR